MEIFQAGLNKKSLRKHYWLLVGSQILPIIGMGEQSCWEVYFLGGDQILLFALAGAQLLPNTNYQKLKIRLNKTIEHI